MFRTLLVCMFLSGSVILLNAQDRYWVGDTGNWSDAANWSATSGGAGGASIPTSANNAIFDAASFPAGGTLTIDVDATCRDFSWSGGNSPALAGNAIRKINIHGSMTLDATMTVPYVGEFIFLSANNETVTSNGVALISRVEFSGSGQWTLQDSLSTDKDVNVDGGTFITNSQKLKADDFGSSLTTTKSINISGSQIELAGNFNASTNMTLNATGSQVVLSNAAAEIRDANGLTFDHILFSNPSGSGAISNSTGNIFEAISFKGSGTIGGSHTIDTIKVEEGKTLALDAGETQVIKDLVAIGGCFNPITINSTFTGSQATLSKSGGAVVVAQVNLQDIDATGGATFTAENSIDLGNNTGWNISLGRNLYWVGGSGNWHEEAYWALTSGGAGGNCPPSEFDNVFFDANSFSPGSSEVSLQNIDGFCKDMDWTGALHSPHFDQTSSIADVFIYGSLMMEGDMTVDVNLDFYFESDDAGEVILSDGHFYANKMYFNGDGEWILQDSLTGTGSNFTLSMSGNSGATLISNDQLIRCRNILCNSTTFFDMGSSHITVETSLIFQSGGTGIQDNGRVTFLNAGTFTGTGMNMNVLDFKGNGIISGSNNNADTVLFAGSGTMSGTVDTFNYVQIGAGGTLREQAIGTLILTAGQRYSMSSHTSNLSISDSLYAISTCGDGYIELLGKKSGSTTSKLTSDKTLNLDFARLFQIDAQGAGIPFNATNSVDMGGNFNINFTGGPRTLFWVGGSGDWNDPTHWSLASGGPGGECIPWKTDDVFFDDNSFVTANDILTLSTDHAYCKDLIFNHTSGNHTLSNSGSWDYYINGSMVFSPFMTILTSGSKDFIMEASTVGNVIDPNGVDIPRRLTINGTGEWTLMDTLQLTNTFSQSSGNFISNSNYISTTSYNISSSANQILGSSTINGTSGSISLTTTGTLDAANATFIINGSSRSIVASDHDLGYLISNGGFNCNFTGNGWSAKRATFFGQGTCTGGSNSCRIDRLTFYSTGTIRGTNNFIDTLDMEPGQSYFWEQGATLSDTVNVWNANGSCAIGNISISSNNTGTQARIYSDNDITLSFVNLTRIDINGPGTYLANNSTDLGGNTGWVFSNSPRTIYWVGGTGVWSDASNWSATSGGVGGECIPTLVDDVFFDANSFTAPGQIFEVDVPASFHDMTWSGITNTPTWNADGGSDVLNVYGSLILDSDIIRNYNRSIYFYSDDVEVFDNDGLAMASLFRFDGNGTFSLSSDMVNSGEIEINNNATVNMSGLSITASNLDINGTASLDITNSDILCNNSSGFAIVEDASLAASGSEIVISNTIASLNGRDHSFNNVWFSNSGQNNKVSCEGCTFNKVKYSGGSGSGGGGLNSSFETDTLELTPGGYFTVFGNRTVTVNNAIFASGDCSANQFTRLIGSSNSVLNCQFPVNLSDMWLTNIIAAGPSLPFNAVNSLDQGGNVNWNFATTASRDLYWVGGTGNWYDVANWSLTSGGASGECVPFPSDNIFFDANSFTSSSQQVTVNAVGLCNNMDWSGSGIWNPTLRMSNDIWIHGSLSLATSMTINSSRELELRSSDPETIIWGGGSISSPIHFNGPGSWDFQDDLNTSTLVYHSDGAINTNNNDVSALSFISNNTTGNTKILNLFNSVFEIERDIDIDQTNYTLNAGTSTIRMNRPSNGTMNFRAHDNAVINRLEFNGTGIGYMRDAQNLTVNEVSFAGNGQILSGSHSFGTMSLSAGRIYYFQAGATQTITGELLANGTCDVSLTLRSSTSSTAFISKASGTVNVSSADIQNLHAIGGASFNAFNSTGTNADGWNIVSGADAVIYWVGGNGNWDDQSNWSYTSGGPGGACLPESTNDVVFDLNSFDATGQTVNVLANAVCKSMTWTGTDNPIFSADALKELSIYGSLEWDANMDLQFLGEIQFESLDTGNTILSNGIIFPTDAIFQGATGEWTLLDAMNITDNLIFRNGTINTNDQAVEFTEMESVVGNIRGLNLGASTVTVRGEGEVWDLNPTSLIFGAGTSLIRFTANEASFDPNDGFTYYNVTFDNADTGRIINSTGVIFNDVVFNTNGSITGSHTYNTLTLGSGLIHNLESGETQTILMDLEIDGSAGDETVIRASSAGNRAIISSANPDCFNYVDLMDNEVSGTVFKAWLSTDSGNNLNWEIDGTIQTDTANFLTCDPNAVGIFIDTLTDVLGCDSVVTSIYVLDSLPPVPVCQDVTIYIDGVGDASVSANDVENGSSDNCAIESLSLDTTDYGCLDTGLNVVTLTVTDSAGNFDVCTAMVQVSDTAGYCALLCETQVINIDQGWSIISSYIDPDIPDVANLFAPVSGDIIVMKDNDGQVYSPSIPINQIGDWDVTQGYKVRALNATSLSIGCSQVDPSSMVINLSLGWEMAAYLRDSDMDIGVALSTINSDLLLAKDGEGMVYIPSLGLNQIGDMSPGMGYQMKLEQATALTYPANTVRVPASMPNIFRSAEHYALNVNTGNNATMVFLRDAITDLEPGDEIGVFNALGNLAGSGVYLNEHLGVAIWGSGGVDELYMNDNDAFVLKVYRPSIGQEFDMEIESMTGDAVYKQNGVSFVQSGAVLGSPSGVASLQELGIAKLNTYPNPVREHLSFDVQLNQSSSLAWHVYNVDGEIVHSSERIHFNSGLQQIQIQTKTWSPGYYFLELSDGDKSHSVPFVKID